MKTQTAQDIAEIIQGNCFPITKLVDYVPLKVSRNKVNRILRLLDESGKFPIHGRFNATNRAIRRLNQYERSNGVMGLYEYLAVFENEVRNIVNNA